MDIKKILTDLKDLLKARYGEEIQKIILFGSRVNGEPRAFSDFDFLIILKNGFDWKLEKEILNLCYEIDLKYDIVTDIQVLSLKDLNTIKGKQPFVLNALEHGIAA